MGLLRLIYHNKTFILVVFLIYLFFWLSIGTFKNRTTDLSPKSPWTRINSQSNSTLIFILDCLFKLKFNLFLIDPYVLNYLFIDKLLLENFNKKFVTFGIIDPSIENILPYLEEKQFTIRLSKSNTLDHIFIEYDQIIVHLAILHPYYTFYLVKKATLSLSDDVRLSYGDTLRAIEHVETDLYDNLFFYPQDFSHFLWLYETSEFLHCNQTLAIEMEQKYKLYQNASQLKLTVVPMRTVAAGLDKLEKHYWLAGGTLLGWYRHCGLIPFTQDADFGLFAEEYDESIRNYFLGNPVCYLWGALGLVNDSLEFRLFTGRFTLDLFWAYRENDHRWCGYQVYRNKFHRTLPLLPKLCSGNLFGYRFSIPCSPAKYLDTEYGPNNWESPKEKNYTWINMKFHSVWNDISWMYATRLYTREGKLRQDQYAIEWISKHFNYSITEIPSFINALPDEPVTLPPMKSQLVYNTAIKRKQTKKKS